MSDAYRVLGLSKLKQQCGPEIKSFRDCVNKNGTESEDVIRVACMNDMNRLWDCTENFHDTMMDQGGQSSQGKSS